MRVSLGVKLGQIPNKAYSITSKREREKKEK
jgi:hypothetical protein